jgi:hypothetical protein
VITDEPGKAEFSIFKQAHLKATWEVFMFIVIVLLDVNVPTVPLLCVIEVTSESFTVAASQFSAIVSFVYFSDPVM